MPWLNLAAILVLGSIAAGLDPVDTHVPPLLPSAGSGCSMQDRVAAAPLAQLIEDYLEEEQCKCHALISDEAALEIVDDAYSEAFPPPASVLRRLVCLSLCSDHEDIEGYELLRSLNVCQAATAPLAPKSAATATFMQPSNVAIGWARVLLARLGPLCGDVFLPGTTEAQSQFRQEVQAEWGRGQDLQYTSTPLAAWADKVIVGAYETIWDLLLRQPLPEAKRRISTQLNRTEFWMSARKHHASPPSTARDGLKEDDGHTSSSLTSNLTQGAWMSLLVFLSIWETMDDHTFLGSSFSPVSRPLTIVFSFSQERATNTWTAATEEDEDRLFIAVKLLSVLAEQCTLDVLSHRTLCLTAERYLARLSQPDFERMAQAAVMIPVFHDMCYVHLYLMCHDTQQPPDLLYCGRRHPQESLLEQLLSWPHPSKTVFDTDINSLSTSQSLRHLSQWYRCAWLTWYLTRSSASHSLRARTVKRVARDMADMENTLNRVISMTSENFLDVANPTADALKQLRRVIHARQHDLAVG